MLNKFNKLDAYLEDTGEARVKIATDNELELFCKDLIPDKKYMYLHVIAMGAGDFYGCNKNGDYFPEKSLIMYHHTFEQNAKIYKEHHNKNGAQNYGNVVKSWYNPEMHRVELILAVDKAKAPDIVSKVERGEIPEVSMGCKVPYDVCSICGNKASKRNEYCEHILHELKHVYPDGRQVYMKNLQPTFFDISFVFRRADKLGLMLRKVAHEYSDDPIAHVEDVPDMEKSAVLDKAVPADAVVRKLNTGMYKLLPMLEKTETDLPPALLDRIASKYNIKDILHTFVQNLVPMKPREFTRIIIVQNGIPLSNYSDVLHGVLHALSLKKYPGGTIQTEISNLLDPFLEMRSSYGPHVVHRVIMLRKSLEKNASMPYGVSFGNHSNNFGPASENITMQYPNQSYNYSEIPVSYNESAYEDKVTRARMLRKPVNPFAIGLSLGAMYMAYRGINSLQGVLNTLTSNKAVAGTGLAALALVGANRHTEKLSSWSNAVGKAVKSVGFTHFVAPFIGAHLASAHYRNKFIRGEDLNSVQMFIAQNPDYLSIAAPFLMHFGTKAVKSNFPKIASYDIPTDVGTGDPDYLNKLANFADSLAQSALAGIIFRGSGASVAGSTTGMLIDTGLFNAAFKPKNPVNPAMQPKQPVNPGIINNKSYKISKDGAK